MAESENRRRSSLVERLRRKRDSETTESPIDDYYEYWDDQNITYTDYDSDYSQERELRDELGVLSKNVRLSLGHRISSMLLSCMFMGRQCSIKNFTTSWNYKYGNCFTFNVSAPSSNQPGPGKGLKVDFYLELNEYVPTISEEAGLRVTVHDANQAPFPDLDGFSVSAGFSSYVGLRKLFIERLSSPYYGCAESSEKGFGNIYSHIYPDGYSVHVCKASCYQHQLAQTCGCIDLQFPSDSPILTKNLTTCTQLKNSVCYETVWSNYLDDRLSCPACYQLCKESSYYTTISNTVWPAPHDAIMNVFYSELKQSKQPAVTKWVSSLSNLSGIDLATAIRNNMARINIFYEDLNYERLVQRPHFTWISFLSNLGGLLGLWVGMSVLSICEWIELAFRLCIRDRRVDACHE